MDERPGELGGGERREQPQPTREGAQQQQQHDPEARGARA